MSRRLPSRLVWSLAVLLRRVADIRRPVHRCESQRRRGFLYRRRLYEWAIDSVFSGAWPFWNIDSALGVPQPSRFRFIAHPLAPLCRMAACAEVLRVAAAIRYVIATQDDEVSPGLRLIKSAAGGVRIFENTDAWLEALFVSAFPTAPLPRYPQCEHDRFLCVDFRSGFEREPSPIEIERHPDGLTLRFAPSAERRNMIVTHWYQPHWRVRSGSTPLVRTAERLIGLEIPTGEQTVTIVYLPVLRAILFFVGILTEAAVFLVIAWLFLARSANEKA